MNGKDALKQQFGFFYFAMKRNLEGLTEEASLKQPSPEGNCANWVLAHLLWVQNSIMGLVNESPAWDNDDLERTRHDPVTCAEEAFDWETMVTKLSESEPRFMAALDALDDDALDDEGFTDVFGRDTTRGGLLGLLAFHQNYHAGQVALSRRMAGLPGAIRAP
jgi:uncharacterized damage-inducible protein DinB